MMVPHVEYPNLYLAVCEVAACNNFRTTPVAFAEALLSASSTNGYAFREVTHENLKAADAFVAALTKEQLLTLCDGEEQDIAELANTSPAGQLANFVLNEFFELAGDQS